MEPEAAVLWPWIIIVVVISGVISAMAAVYLAMKFIDRMRDR